MPLVTLNAILPAARAAGHAVAAFNVANYETAVAAITAAEAERRPVILAVYHRLLADPRLGAVIATLRHLGTHSPMPVAVHLDHGASLDHVRRAIDLGFTSVMLDGSRLPLRENIAVTRQAADLAHAAGLSIEGEIGQLPTVGQPIPYTDPDEAEVFVRETAIDAVAVAIGTAHGFYSAPPVLKVGVAIEVGRRVSIPMVLHGGSDTPHDQVRAAIRAGMAKVNFSTEYQALFQQRLKARLLELGEKFAPVDQVLKPAVEAASAYMAATIRRLADTGD